MNRIGFFVLVCALFMSLQLLANNDTINQLDGLGRKTGYWMIYGQDRPDLGYADDCMVEEGTYKAGRKTGRWVKYFPDGKTPKLIAHYQNNRPHGKFNSFHPNGNKKESGNYRNRKYTGEYKSWYASGCIQQEKFYNEQGHLDKYVVYYFDQCDPNQDGGQIEFKYKIRNGVPVESAYRYYPNGDFRTYIVYNDDGSIKSEQKFARINPPVDL